MKTLIWLIVLACIAVTISFFATWNQGYLLFVIPPYSGMLSINGFILLQLLALPFIYIIMRLAILTFRLPSEVRAHQQKQKHMKHFHYLQDAWISYFQGRYQRAERASKQLLEEGAEGRTLTVASLLGAHSSQIFRDIQRRNHYLASISDDDAETLLASRMMQAKMFFDERDYQSALASLDAAKSLSPKLTSALQLEFQIRQRLNQHEAVLALIEPLEKAELMEPSKIEQARIFAVIGRLNSDMPLKKLQEFWQKLPPKTKVNSRVATAGAQRFKLNKECDFALSIIENALSEEWNSELVTLYGNLELQAGCKRNDPMRVIQKAEDWLKQHPEDAVLLLTLSRLCRAKSLWGKASTYAEASVAISPNPETFLILAEMAEEHNDTAAAQRYYQAGLRLALKK